MTEMNPLKTYDEWYRIIGTHARRQAVREPCQPSDDRMQLTPPEVVRVGVPLTRAQVFDFLRAMRELKLSTVMTANQEDMGTEDGESSDVMGFMVSLVQYLYLRQEEGQRSDLFIDSLGAARYVNTPFDAVELWWDGWPGGKPPLMQETHLSRFKEDLPDSDEEF